MDGTPPTTTSDDSLADQRRAERAALAAELATFDYDRLPEFDLLDVIEARARQADHERGELLAAVGSLLRHELPGGAVFGHCPGGVVSDEVRATLHLTRAATKRMGELAWDLRRRLPAVLAAMRAGQLDQPRAQVFSSWTEDLTREHTGAVVVHLLPEAPLLTTGELIDAIAKSAIALDPEWVRRRYQRALQTRRVAGTRNPDGTATLTGHQLPLDEVAAACAHLDTLATAARSAGHPDRLDHLRADLLVGMITGRYTALTDQQILAHLAATAPSTPDTTTGASDDGPDDDGPDDGGPGDAGPAAGPPDPDGPDRDG